MKNFWPGLAAEARSKLKKPIIALAPMAGITDSAFRQICKDFGADLVYSEMVCVDGLHYKSKKTFELLKFSKKEKPIVIQLFGSKPQLFIEAAKIVEKLGADGIDINFGCPAPKIYKSGGGVKLMRDLDLCYQIIKAICDAVKIPVSVKIRSSINSLDGKKITALDFIKKIKDLPISAIMVHGRSYEKGFGGPVDLEIIKKVKENFSGLVLGNGGITTPEKAREMLDITGVDGIGLAQGVLGKPWLFEQVKEYLKSGKYKEYIFPQIKKVALKHAQLNFKLKSKQGILEMRKHLAWYAHGFQGASALRQKLIRVENFREIKKIFGFIK
ncbi:tRNA dihydrouridine synthase DusB [Candidatus Falkowbacteria bacterium]|nr:tRNA dihydrouridine synthase DusB [Candidatus Falkowbacteria bacterium]